MNFDQLVIREYLKHNPTLKDAPEVLRSEYKEGAARGLMRWRNLPDANLYGTAFFNYEIPDLGVLFSGLTVTLHVWKPTTHRDVAQVLFDTYGVIANIDDIVPTAMSFNPLPDYVDLVAANGAKSLKGTLRVFTLPKVMPLDELITVQEVDALVDKYPLQISEMQAIKKYYGYDYTDLRFDMANYRVNDWLYRRITDVDGQLNSPVNMIHVREEMDGPTWIFSSDVNSDFNGNNIKIVYNGPTLGKPESNQSYTNVLVGECYGSYKVRGFVYLHYNM